jgi:hypothetical protein
MRGKGHYKKVANIWLMAGTCFSLAVIMVLSVPESAICGSQNDRETEAVLQAARKFLDAEIRRDYPAVYACLAPSSTYVRTNSYKQYIVQAKAAPDRVVKYRIIDITYIKNNEDRKTSPTVEKVAQVEVDVTLLHIDTRQRSEVNIGFIFLKEGGRWYKS